MFEECQKRVICSQRREIVLSRAADERRTRSRIQLVPDCPRARPSSVLCGGCPGVPAECVLCCVLLNGSLEGLWLLPALVSKWTQLSGQLIRGRRRGVWALIRWEMKNAGPPVDSSAVTRPFSVIVILGLIVVRIYSETNPVAFKWND